MPSDYRYVWLARKTSVQEPGGYAAAPDGRRFLTVKPVEEQRGPTRINVVLNWTKELKSLVAVGKP
jgi:hypothetical protein